MNKKKYHVWAWGCEENIVLTFCCIIMGWGIWKFGSPW